MPSSAARPSAARRRVLVAGLLLMGAGMRLYHLDYRSLSTDEANVFWIARGPVAEIIHQNAIGNSAPPLYALALNPLAEAHASEAALRSLSCAAGIAALLALYLLAREYTGPTGALFALFLAAIAPSQVFYSQFLREYSLAFLCAALLLFAFTRFQRRPTWANWSALTASAVIGILLQYGLALLVLGLNAVFAIALIAARQRSARLAWWTLAQIPVLAAAWVVYDQTLRHQLHPGGFGVSYLAQGYWDGGGASLLRLVVGNSFELLGFAHPAVPVLQGLLVLGAIELWRRADGRRAILMLFAPLAITIAAACLRLYPYLGARQSMMLMPMLYVCAAAGFLLLRRLDWKAVGTTVVLAWLAVEGLYGCYRTLTSTEPQHVRPIAALLAGQMQPDDRLYVYHHAVTPMRYYSQEGSQWVRGVPSPSDPAPHQRQLAEVFAQPGRVWMVFSHCERGECDVIRRAAVALRRLELVATETGTTLYLAQPATRFPP